MLYTSIGWHRFIPSLRLTCSWANSGACQVKAGVKSVGQENGRADGKGGKGSRAAHYRL